MDAGERRPTEGLVPMPIEFIAPVVGSLLLGFFGWLKYRAYL